MSNIKTIAITAAAVVGIVTVAGAAYLSMANFLDRREADKRYAKVLKTCKNVLARGRVSDEVKAEVVKLITRLEEYPEISMDRFEAIWAAEKFLASIDFN